MEPLRFAPLLKRIRWGGRRLGTALGKPIGPEGDYAESWEISDHGTDQSRVAAGSLAGLSLHELLDRHRSDLLGRHADRTQFPLLIKYLDARDRLSLQVHPDDRLAREFNPVENGKTEAWVIIDAEPGSRLFAGLKPGVDAVALRDALAAGRIDDCVHSFAVRPGDGVFIPAGTVHAIGEGVLLAEVQQSSDLTFRLHDWGRVGPDGRPRELHLDAAFRCIDFQRGPVDPVEPRPFNDGFLELVRCEHFVIRCLTLTSRRAISLPDDDRFHILMGLAGRASVGCGSIIEPLGLGQTLLLPAARDAVCLEVEDSPGAELEDSSGAASGESVILDVFLP